MVQKNKKSLVIILSVFSVLAFASFAFAMNHMGNNPHGKGKMNGGMGMGIMGNMNHMSMGVYNNSCRLNYNYMSKNFSDEDIKKIETERDKFLVSTKSSRKSIYIKQHELKNELAKENPNMEKTWKLREKISGLQADLDKKRFEFMQAMKVINPKAGKSLMENGKGKMKCKMMGGM